MREREHVSASRCGRDDVIITSERKTKERNRTPCLKSLEAVDCVEMAQRRPNERQLSMMADVSIFRSERQRGMRPGSEMRNDGWSSLESVYLCRNMPRPQMP